MNLRYVGIFCSSGPRGEIEMNLVMLKRSEKVMTGNTWRVKLFVLLLFLSCQNGDMHILFNHCQARDLATSPINILCFFKAKKHI